MVSIWILCYQYYKIKELTKEELYVPYYDVISTNLVEDAKKLKKLYQI